MVGSNDPGPNPERSVRWVVGDIVIAALFAWITVVSLNSDAFAAENGPIQGAEWILALSPILLLPLRRVAPAAVFVLAAVLYLVISVTLGNSNAPLAAPFFTYSVGLARRPTEAASLVFTAATVLSVATFFGPGDPEPLTAIVWFLLFGSGWAVATSISQNRSRAIELSDELVNLEAQQAEVARAAIADERGRIARELHDAVGHAVNVIVLQAGAARLAADPQQALDTLHQIEHVGRSALVDLDHLLGLLDGETEASRAPSRNVKDIAALVDDLRSAGADITLHDDCDCDVDWRTGAAAHRIAQEALTNAIKHAGHAHIDLTLSCSQNELRLVVTDDGQGTTATRSPSGGRGIPSMTERARVLGGHVTASTAPNGGFIVEASLPKKPSNVAPSPTSEAATP